MLDFGEIAPRFANAFVTIALAILLFNIYKKGRKDFYLLWSLGYFFYGANILVRTFLPEGEITPFILLTAGYRRSRESRYAMRTSVSYLNRKIRSVENLARRAPTLC